MYEYMNWATDKLITLRFGFITAFPFGESSRSRYIDFVNTMRKNYFLNSNEVHGLLRNDLILASQFDR